MDGVTDISILGSIWAWGNITDRGTCERWKAAVAFSFLSGIFWLASTLLGLWFVHKARRGQPVAVDGTAGYVSHPLATTSYRHMANKRCSRQRTRWYRRHRV
jgi:hypothetical protein